MADKKGRNQPPAGRGIPLSEGIKHDRGKRRDDFGINSNDRPLPTTVTNTHPAPPRRGGNKNNSED